MLLRFQVSNHRSILEPVELSMIAIDEDRPAVRSFDLLSERVLTIASIYGPNASGKTNVLDAIGWLASAVRTSLRRWDDAIPRHAHSFSEGPSTPTVFDVDLVGEGVRYGYQLEVDDTAVLYESLCSYPERRRRVLYEREGSAFTPRRGLSTARGIEELLTPTTLALSAATRLRDPEVQDAGNTLAGVRTRGFWRTVTDGGFLSLYFGSPSQLFDKDAGAPTQEHAASHLQAPEPVNLLRLADPSIEDVDIAEAESAFSDDRRREMRFVHRSGSEAVTLRLSDESAGTRTWLGLLEPVLDALRGGRVLLFDEIDASLHPRLSARLLELFQDPETNPHRAQLIFTTHDTSLLNVLNRDEVWLTEKQSGGASRLVALAEFGGERVRKSLNLERAYLQGRFGAVPDVDQAAVRDALGLDV